MEKTKIAWLSGLIDGEGSIGLYPTKHKHGYVYAKRLEIGNSDILIMLEVQSLLSELVGYKLTLMQNTKMAHSVKRVHILYRVSVNTRNGLMKVLPILIPYLIGKKSQAQILLEVLRSHIPNTKYTKAERQVEQILKAMKTQNMRFVDVNAEPSREPSASSQACVENLQAATQMSLG